MAERWLKRQRWRWIGRYTIDDPRPIAANAPYTFHLPSENELLAIAPGDDVKLIIRSIPPGLEWDAERMWVKVKAVNDVMSGALANTPSDMPQLQPGSRIEFRRSDIIDINWSAERTVAPPPAPARRWYWERCLVDDCILRGESPVDYIYRENPIWTRKPTSTRTAVGVCGRRMRPSLPTKDETTPSNTLR